MSAVYVTSDVKRRPRSTQVEMATFRRAIFDIVAEHQPCSGRQVYYRAVVAGLVEKDAGTSRKNEKRVADALNNMREAFIDHTGVIDERATRNSIDAYRRFGIMPFEWITDDTRVRFQPRMYASRDAGLHALHHAYRRNLWQSQSRQVEVWCESSSLAAVLLDITDDYGVTLLPCRGQAGKRFIWDSARVYAAAGRPITCLYVGDFDPSGLDIGNSVERRIQRYLQGADVDIEFHRLAITAEQVRDLGLPGHGINTNISDSQRGRFLAVCEEYGIPHEAVEAEAMAPGRLRHIVAEAIESHIDPRQWALELAVEESERRDIWHMIGGAA